MTGSKEILLMIKINLLSPNDRLSAKWEKINKIIISSAAAVIITQLVFASSIFASMKYLKIESDSLDTQLENLQMESDAKEIKEMKGVINDYDEQLKCIDQIQKNHICWTQMFGSFSEIIPGGVKIKELSIREYKDDPKEKTKSSDNEKYIMNIKGIAKKREYLLEFENNLKNSEIFEPIIFGDYMENNYKKEIDADFEHDILINKSDVLMLKQ